MNLSVSFVSCEVVMNVVIVLMYCYCLLYIFKLRGSQTFSLAYHVINPFQSNFPANRILPSSYLFWAGKRLMDYL
jgi:hypothetical protein